MCSVQKMSQSIEEHVLSKSKCLVSSDSALKFASLIVLAASLFTKSYMSRQVAFEQETKPLSCSLLILLSLKDAFPRHSEKYVMFAV